jgi:hypothetical protein
LGPAYAWSHLHLSASIDADPFDAKVTQVTRHPPDQARMEAILYALDLLNFGEEKKEIEARWNDFLKIIEAKNNTDYMKACPKELLEQASIYALEATKKIGCSIADKNSNGNICCLLNEAWCEFWKAPDEYHDWEKQKVEKLKTL